MSDFEFRITSFYGIHGYEKMETKTIVSEGALTAEEIFNRNKHGANIMVVSQELFDKLTEAMKNER